MESLATDTVQVLTTTFRERTSVCIFIKGRRGTGKTDLGLLIGETLLDEGIIKEPNFATNVAVYPSSTIKPAYINALDDLEYWAANVQGKKIYVFDEFGKIMRRRSPMSSINLALMDQLQVLRKYKLSLILIAPQDYYVDNAALGSDVLDAIIDKPNYRNQKVALYTDLLENVSFRLLDIPRTSIKFNTDDQAVFKLTSGKRTNFKEEDKNTLWKWAVEDATIESLGLHRETFNRKVKSFVKDVLEKERQLSHI
jgi:hypothetical protein